MLTRLSVMLFLKLSLLQFPCDLGCCVLKNLYLVGKSDAAAKKKGSHKIEIMKKRAIIFLIWCSVVIIIVHVV